MSVPSYDLSKVQFSSEANSFKNDGFLYTGTLVFATSIPAGSVETVTQSFTISSSPQFSMLFGFFQEYMDTLQQQTVGSGYNTAQWYDSNANNKVGFVVTAPAPDAGALEGLLYPVINGTSITITAIVNNPYADNITLQALSIPWAFLEYTMTN